MKNYLTEIFKRLTLADWTGILLTLLYLAGKEYWWHRNKGRLTVNTILEIRERNLKKSVEIRKKDYEIFIRNASNGKELSSNEISNIKFLFGLEHEK